MLLLLLPVWLLGLLLLARPVVWSVGPYLTMRSSGPRASADLLTVCTWLEAPPAQLLTVACSW